MPFLFLSCSLMQCGRTVPVPTTPASRVVSHAGIPPPNPWRAHKVKNKQNPSEAVNSVTSSKGHPKYLKGSPFGFWGPTTQINKFSWSAPQIKTQPLPYWETVPQNWLQSHAQEVEKFQDWVVLSRSSVHWSHLKASATNARVFVAVIPLSPTVQ